MKVKQSPIAAAVTMTLLSITMAAQAQQAATAPAAAQDTAQLEAVVITGIRASLQSAANIKKGASAVVDAVSAEDIGKLPDSDVGQALGRIPGVTVGRAFGQGASVSIRGTDPQMTYTTLNGQSVASTGWYDQQTIDRSFNYSLLPAELIGGMEVFKSAQADLTEGGIGGTVIVRTRKPLDLDANTAFVSAKLGKGSVSDDLSKEVSGLYSWKDSQKKFGALIAVAYEDSEYIRRGIESDARWSGDVAPTTFVQDRKRTAVNVALQARPTKSIDLGLNYLALELTGDNSNTSHYIFPGNAKTDACSQKNAAGLCTKSDITAANATDAFVQTWARTGKMTSDTLALTGTFRADTFKVDAAAGSTKAEGGTSQTTNYSYGWWTAGSSLPKWVGSIDATGKQISVNPGANQNVALSNLPAKTGPAGSWATSRGPNSDKETYAQADLTMDLELGPINSFKTGVRATDHEFKKSTDRASFAATAIEADTASLYNGNIAMGTNGWNSPKPNIGGMMANTNANVTGWTEERGGLGIIKEKNTAAYGMFEFEKDQWRGNFGLRYISSKVTGTGYAFDGTPLATGDIDQNQGWSKNRTSKDASYSDWLPSLNVAYTLQKNTLLRMAAGQAITRPNFDNMFLASQSGWKDTVAGNETMTFGDVGLKPQKSTQFDLGLEYYYGKGNLVAGGVFYKDINNFITTNTKVDQKIGVISPDSGKDSWTVNQFVNAGGGKIRGLEAQINHAFDNGFGVAANYTYSDATAPGESFQDRRALFTLASKHTYNVVGYYEMADFSARMAYNYRSEYMIRETGWYGNRMHEGFGTLDLGLGYNITKNIRLNFDATNLLAADDVQFGAAGVDTTVKAPLKVGYPAWSFMGERTYRVGISAKF
ncbi:TonB-dependent receptor [Paucibacter sp. TC2R-5]|uniref:TonB-dependent receptor n=1 Tax=Paucibacter sp. TC2R-5 TaxID=2893555 RepID=UPI0021E496C5|nr:TonB-dependent receptor [Paucibacter sp. TC2R-5]MCV2361692.1 TonB-dependent receptor [Paucibacter sp. TC2R-5]